jgi:hypothetical protein
MGREIRYLSLFETRVSCWPLVLTEVTKFRSLFDFSLIEEIGCVCIPLKYIENGANGGAVKALLYKPEGSGFDSRRYHNFSVALWPWVSTQLLTDMSKSSPITGPNRPTGFQEVKAPRFLDIGT